MNYFKGKRLIWTVYFRLFCDNGQPKFTYIPKFRILYYSVHWNMWGFAIYLFGREFNFSFGKDVNHLYGGKTVQTINAKHRIEV